MDKQFEDVVETAIGIAVVDGSKGNYAKSIIMAAFDGWQAALELTKQSEPVGYVDIYNINFTHTFPDKFTYQISNRKSKAFNTPLYTEAIPNKDAERLEKLEECLNHIKAWCKAYPITIFTEPDWKVVQEKLGDTLLTQVSGSNMRHVVDGIQKIIDEAIERAKNE